MTQNVRDQVIDLLLKQLKTAVPASDLTDDRSIEDLGLSSLNLVNLMYELEDCFSIDLDPEEMLSIGTVGELVLSLEHKVAASERAATAG